MKRDDKLAIAGLDAALARRVIKDKAALDEAEWDELAKDEGAILDAVWRGETICPLCHAPFDYVTWRGPRMTFAGPEPACVQYLCNDCGLGGESEPQTDEQRELLASKLSSSH